MSQAGVVTMKAMVQRLNRRLERDSKVLRSPRALISMMARSRKGSNQRPDTLMRDRTSANSKKSSCNARPDHTVDQLAPKSV
jgi:hypothetical protein